MWNHAYSYLCGMFQLSSDGYDTEFLCQEQGSLQYFFEMVQGYPQTDCRGTGGWPTFGNGKNICPPVLSDIAISPISFTGSYIGGDPYEQWPSRNPEKPDLPGSCKIGGEVGGPMLNVTGLNHFYYVRDFTDMRCKHSRVLSIIRERLHREPVDGDVFIVMSRNRRIVRMFTYDNRSYGLFEKKFVSGYQFMKVERKGGEKVYRIDWRDVVLLLGNPIVKTLKIR